MVCLRGERVQPCNQISRGKARPLAVAGIRHDADDSVLRDGASGPAFRLIGRPPDMSAVMEGMIRVDQRDDDVDVEQRAHDSDALLLHQAMDFFRRDDFATRRQQGHATASLRWGTFRRYADG